MWTTGQATWTWEATSTTRVHGFSNSSQETVEVSDWTARQFCKQSIWKGNDWYFQIGWHPIIAETRLTESYQTTEWNRTNDSYICASSVWTIFANPEPGIWFYSSSGLRAEDPDGSVQNSQGINIILYLWTQLGCARRETSLQKINHARTMHMDRGETNLVEGEHLE